MRPVSDAAPVRVFIGLGGNLGETAAHLHSAREAISHLAGVTETGFSGLYRSPPLGPPDQPDYVNAVMAVDTTLDPLGLLDRLQAIESAHGRVRSGARWTARTLDLDILLYGERILRLDRLTVPHPGLAERDFVLYPLADIAPELIVPGVGALRDLLRDCPRRGLVRLDAD